MTSTAFALAVLLGAVQQPADDPSCVSVEYSGEVAAGSAEYIVWNRCGYDVLVSLSFVWGGTSGTPEDPQDRIFVVSTSQPRVSLVMKIPFVPEWKTFSRWPPPDEGDARVQGSTAACTKVTVTNIARPGGDVGEYVITNNCSTCRDVVYREAYWRPDAIPPLPPPVQSRVRLQPKDRKEIGTLPRGWRVEIVSSEVCKTSGGAGGVVIPSPVYPPPKSPAPIPLPFPGNRPDPPTPPPASPGDVRVVP